MRVLLKEDSRASERTVYEYLIASRTNLLPFILHRCGGVNNDECNDCISPSMAHGVGVSVAAREGLSVWLGQPARAP